MHVTMKKKDEHLTYNKNILDSWKNAINGIIYATTTQKHIQKQLLIIVAVLLISLFFNLNRVEFLVLLFAAVLIIIAEMLNTGIETVVDLYTDLYHPKAKIAKDVGAGAVVMAAINAVVVAYFLFFDKIATIGANMLESLLNTPEHLAFTALILTAIAAIALKAVNIVREKKGVKERFLPSSATAMAFAAAMIIWLSAKNMIAFTLGLILAIIVACTRIENNQRTWGEVLFGAFIGCAITAIMYGLTLL